MGAREPVRISRPGSITHRLIDLAATERNKWWGRDELYTEYEMRWPGTNQRSLWRSLQRAVERGELEADENGRVRAPEREWAHLDEIAETPEELEAQIAELSAELGVENPFARK